MDEACVYTIPKQNLRDRRPSKSPGLHRMGHGLPERQDKHHGVEYDRKH